MGGQASGETWIWSGTAWTMLVGVGAGAGPEARSRAALVYDSVRDLFVLFGGLGAAPLGDTWTLGTVGTQWALVSTILNPSEDAVPSATFNTLSGAIVLVAGGETWTQTGTTWNAAAWPSSSKHPGLVFDPGLGRVVSISEARTPSQLNAGGWSPDLNNREPLAGPLGLISAYSPRRGRTLVVEPGATWEWDARSWHQVPTTTQLDPRGAAMVFDTACDVAVVFGGLGGAGVGDSTWVYDGTWTRRQIAGPSARTLHAMTYDAKRNVVVVFGGFSSTSQLLGDVWELGGPCTARTWTQVSTTNGPTARKSSRLAFDRARGVSMLFGGEDGNERADTWEWDGTTWTNRSAAISPPPRFEHAMVYDQRRRAVVMFGGTADTLVLGDTWTWNGTAWVKLSPITSPPGRRAMTMSVENSGGIVMFGGENAEIGQRRDIWRLASETNLEPVERCAIAAVDEDGDGLPTCEDPDCGWRCAPLCSLGGSCTSPSCGDGTCSAVEDHVMCPADCMAP